MVKLPDLREHEVNVLKEIVTQMDQTGVEFTNSQIDLKSLYRRMDRLHKSKDQYVRYIAQLAALGDAVSASIDMRQTCLSKAHRLHQAILSDVEWEAEQTVKFKTIVQLPAAEMDEEEETVAVEIEQMEGRRGLTDTRWRSSYRIRVVLLFSEQHPAPELEWKIEHDQMDFDQVLVQSVESARKWLRNRAQRRRDRDA